MIQRIRQVEWATSTHAYGPAEDVGPELEALTLGDEATRRTAWSELWGNVQHQGTVYEATVPAVEVVADLAARAAFPDRREALCMLAAFAEGSGEAAPQVAARVHARACDLVTRWRDEPALLQRALLLLSRSAGVQNNELRSSVLPERFEPAWALGTSREIWAAFEDDEPLDDEGRQRFDAAMDALADLEGWAFSEET